MGSVAQQESDWRELQGKSLLDQEELHLQAQYHLQVQEQALLDTEL